MDYTGSFLTEISATLVGIFVGTLAAMAVERHNQRQRKRQRAGIILRSLMQELSANMNTIKNVRQAYLSTPWGKSFYVSTTSWETAVSSGDLPDIIGFEMADSISAQYALLVRIRYYVDLLTRLWFAPSDIPGYEEKRKGFNDAITESMNQAMQKYTGLLHQMEKAINGL
jgi:hypothetical protein